MAGAWVGETERLVLRRFTLDDAALVKELVNEDAWLRYIGDRNVRTLDDARAFVAQRLLGPYERLGYGFYRVELKDGGEPVGLCGMVKRDGLGGDVDIGYGLLLRHAGRGYALESALEVVRQARDVHGLTRLVAIVNPANARSIALLVKLGMTFERSLRVPGDEHDVSLYGMALRPSAS